MSLLYERLINLTLIDFVSTWQMKYIWNDVIFHPSTKTNIHVTDAKSIFIGRHSSHHSNTSQFQARSKSIWSCLLQFPRVTIFFNLVPLFSPTLPPKSTMTPSPSDQVRPHSLSLPSNPQQQQQQMTLISRTQSLGFESKVLSTGSQPYPPPTPNPRCYKS